MGTGTDPKAGIFVLVSDTPEMEIKLGARTLIMGIINLTSDSFSDGGMFGCVDDAVQL